MERDQITPRSLVLPVVTSLPLVTNRPRSSRSPPAHCRSRSPFSCKAAQRHSKRHRLASTLRLSAHILATAVSFHSAVSTLVFQGVKQILRVRTLEGGKEMDREGGRERERERELRANRERRGGDRRVSSHLLDNKAECQPLHTVYEAPCLASRPGQAGGGL